ncbi:hypothetical protein [Rathayibacter soli]|uniref:hypothetical protein n=1 Tax=Rathayibacter soli TaxID=3144168 RepID=UPI0027E56A3C|nr:hypothetical protein [Glaciibacter superstes]
MTVTNSIRETVQSWEQMEGCDEGFVYLEGPRTGWSMTGDRAAFAQLEFIPQEYGGEGFGVALNIPGCGTDLENVLTLALDDARALVRELSALIARLSAATETPIRRMN